MWKYLEILGARVKVVKELADIREHQHHMTQDDMKTAAAIVTCRISTLEETAKLSTRFPSSFELPTTDDFKYQCPAAGCPRHYKRLDRWHHHIRTATTPKHKAHKEIIDQTCCLPCEQVFTRSKDLINHERSRHGEVYDSRLFSFIQCRRPPGFGGEDLERGDKAIGQRVVSMKEAGTERTLHVNGLIQTMPAVLEDTADIHSPQNANFDLQQLSDEHRDAQVLGSLAATGAQLKPSQSLGTLLPTDQSTDMLASDLTDADPSFCRETFSAFAGIASSGLHPVKGASANGDFNDNIGLHGDWFGFNSAPDCQSFGVEGSDWLDFNSAPVCESYGVEGSDWFGFNSAADWLGFNPGVDEASNPLAWSCAPCIAHGAGVSPMRSVGRDISDGY